MVFWLQLNASNCHCDVQQLCFRPIDLLEPLVCFPNSVNPNNLDDVPTLRHLEFLLYLSLFINFVCFILGLVVSELICIHLSFDKIFNSQFSCSGFEGGLCWRNFVVSIRLLSFPHLERMMVLIRFLWMTFDVFF